MGSSKRQYRPKVPRPSAIEHAYVGPDNYISAPQIGGSEAVKYIEFGGWLARFWCLHRQGKPVRGGQLTGQRDAVPRIEGMIGRAEDPAPHFRAHLDDFAVERSHGGCANWQEAHRTGVSPPREDFGLFARLEPGEDLGESGQTHLATTAHQDRLLTHKT